MKHLLHCAIIFVALTLPSLGGTDSEAVRATLARLEAVKGPFTFAVIGDNRSGDRVYKKIIARTMSRRPIFVVNTGDIIPNAGTRSQWKNFWELSGKITAPYFLTPGNHDIDDKKSEAIWQDEVDLPGNELYYSFIVGKTLFVILDTCEPDQDRRIAGRQYEWLKGVLDPKKFEHQFVFLHHPLFPPKSKYYGESLDRYPKLRDRLHDLFVEKKVTAVINGHVHAFRRMEKDGVPYITTGGAGAPLYGRDSYNHVMIMRIDGPRIEAKIIDREGAMRDEFVLRTHFKTSPTATLDFWLRLRQISRKTAQRSLSYASRFFAHLPRLAQKSGVSLTGRF